MTSTRTGRSSAASAGIQVRQVLSATSPADLFGPTPAKDDTDGWAAAKRCYRLIARQLHPDVCHEPDAEQAFTRLAELWQALQSPTAAAVTITTRKRSYVLGAVAHRGDIANLYAATCSEAGRSVLVKMPRSTRSNDLLEAEAKALNQLHRDGDPKYHAYVPTLVETFRHRDSATGVDRRVNVLERLDGFVTLADVEQAYPGGLDPRDAAWMWRRLLVAVGYAHHAGVIHGAVVPEHVLISPAEHGLVLTDWCYATTETAQTIPAIVARHRDLYPPEVLTKKVPSAATDIYLLTRTMTRVIGPRMPPQMKTFADGCTQSDQRNRPNDAWKLLAEFDALLERLYGPRRFRVFTMPGR